MAELANAINNLEELDEDLEDIENNVLGGRIMRAPKRRRSKDWFRVCELSLVVRARDYKKFIII